MGKVANNILGFGFMAVVLAVAIYILINYTNIL